MHVHDTLLVVGLGPISWAQAREARSCALAAAGYGLLMYRYIVHKLALTKS